LKLEDEFIEYGIPKISTSTEIRILKKLFHFSRLSKFILPSSNILYVHRIAGSGYHIKCFDFIPYFKNDKDGIKKSEDYKQYSFNRNSKEFVSIFNSTHFYFYWQIFYDAFKAGKYSIENYPYYLDKEDLRIETLIELSDDFMRDLKKKSERLTV